MRILLGVLVLLNLGLYLWLGPYGRSAALLPGACSPIVAESVTATEEAALTGAIRR